MLPQHWGAYPDPKPILDASLVVFACAVASATQGQWRRAAGATAQSARPPRRGRWLTIVARALTICSLVLAVGLLILYLRYRLDPTYQPSSYLVSTAIHVTAIIPTIVLLGQGTLLVTVLFFCARLVVVLRRHGGADGGLQDGVASTSSGESQ
jgi:hypothetical protein